ncbi:MAG: polymerase, sigma-24 subunit, subfamily [Mucilaginibacter sp.]|nr:polymerase, sigma-24 subunit, subfamily [Mucilaginibacter sp.]
MEPITDQELLTGLRSSDHRSFRYLYDKYWERLYLSACRRIGDEFEAEEVTQDVFCNLWRRRDRLELRSGFEAYLTVAVKFEVINRLAKKANQRIYQHHIITNYSELAHTTTEHINLQDLQHQIARTVNTLPDKCRTAFKLSREKGYSNKQISTQMDISIKTVEAHISKALKMLRVTFGSLPFLLMFFIN